ncbi:hypothetical protein CEE45_00915 [Candidatus Heimdallarchaeota archaeon B3_Heim]|nr:MAG: hypothetical protein CEE45_00915 [Candidatus Heimdallarchaeota archaeon B3_Heim]
MAGKKIIIKSIHCSLSPSNQEKSPGFQVTGYKELKTEDNAEKIGFIVSGIRILIFQQTKNLGIRTRMKWISKGFEIREEIHPISEVVADPQRKNNILFVSKEDNSMVVMQGEPVLKDHAFVGQIINVNWKETEITIFPHNKTIFHCVLDSRNSRINCIVK